LNPIAVSQIPSDKVAAYIKGRRDEQASVVSIIDLLRIEGFLGVDTCNILLDYMNKIDQRPKVNIDA
jgi:hypothetical protein